MNQTLKHGLPLLAAGQAQKEVTHNEALLVIDRRLQMAVESRTLPAPAVPASGAAYIVPVDATGAWSGQGNRVAGYDGFGWTFDEPQRGWLAWIADEQCLHVYDGGWRAVAGFLQPLIAGGSAPEERAIAIADPSGGAVVDAEGRAALGQLLAILRVQSLIP